MAFRLVLLKQLYHENLHEANKVYQGEITLGFSTETEDAHGEIVSSSPC